jgi:phosphatidylinositol phospholipase C delta
MNILTSAISKLSTRPPKDDEDEGEVTDHPLAGGGHAGRYSAHIDTLRVSHAMRNHLVRLEVLNDATLHEADDHHTEELKRLLHKPHVIVPPSLTDRSHPLQDYFISSSHNTYLLAHQLYGDASAEAYEEHLKAGARCVEIDAWDGDDKDEPKVTHGWTLTDHIPFRAVCETIRDVVDHESKEAIDQQGYRAAPILISLENHCAAHGQERMVQIMKDTFGDRLLSKSVREHGHQQQAGMEDHPITLAELGSKIAVIVEYHFPNEKIDSDSSDDEEEDEAEKQKRREYRKEKEKAAPSAVIVPALSELGVYAQSVKPPNNAWFEKGILEGSPHHPLINVSETGLAAHLPQHSDLIARHNANYLMRVYPKGTRISSGNLNPVPFWDVGAQVCALNWQTFGASMQLNEALFTGTDGYVLKPTHLRIAGQGMKQKGVKRKLRLHVAGASAIPVPRDRPQDGSDIKPYLTCTLVDPSHQALDADPPKKKTKPYKQHHLTAAFHQNNPPNIDPIWGEALEWEYEDSELVFLRMLIKSDDAFAANPKLAVAAVRLSYAVTGEWLFVRMLSLAGRETGCTLVVKFEVD